MTETTIVHENGSFLSEVLTELEKEVNKFTKNGWRTVGNANVLKESENIEGEVDSFIKYSYEAWMTLVRDLDSKEEQKS